MSDIKILDLTPDNIADYGVCARANEKGSLVFKAVQIGPLGSFVTIEGGCLKRVLATCLYDTPLTQLLRSIVQLL